MPFFWKSTSGRKRASISPQRIENAVKAVVAGGGLRASAKEFSVDKQTLSRYVKKYKQADNKKNVSYKPNYVTNQLFSEEEEHLLEMYLKRASKLHYGLSSKDARRLAYLFAIKNNKVIPTFWKTCETASYDWLRGFLHRHKSLSLRTPESTSLGRATGFNRANVDTFFENLYSVMGRDNFGPESIFNVDETALTTVHKPGKIIACKGEKQVGKVTSAERGTLVTLCAAINAIGNSIPPFLVFPRVHPKEHMSNGAPPGTAVVCHPSGWMTGNNFEQFLFHFKKYVMCSPEKKVLIIMDNHDSHVTPNGLDFCKDNGIILLTLPPHTSHKLQPLDRGVFGPLKSYYNTAADEWMINHPGRAISIYEIGELLGKAFPSAFTPQNIMSGFRKTGIYPLNRNIFTDDEFLSSYVTDRQENSANKEDSFAEVTQQDKPTTSSEDVPPAESTSLKDTIGVTKIITPEEIKPFPKAGPRKKSLGRKPKKSRILTDTPIKAQIQQEFESRSSTKRKLHLEPVCIKKKKSSLILSGKNETSSSEDEDLILSSGDSIDSSSFQEEVLANDEDFDPTVANIGIGDFVLVQFASKRNISYYIGSVVGINQTDEEYEINFLKRYKGKLFIYPEIQDKSFVDAQDIVMKLQKPVSVGGTRRLQNQFVFNVDFSGYCVQ